MPAPSSRPPAGTVRGSAAGSLNSPSSRAFAKNQATARAGAVGEKRTATALSRLARRPGGPTVLHDLKIPIAGVSANIDHVVVVGRTVIILDSKVWRPGFYWTLPGVGTFRGARRFSPADKKTMVMARRSLRRHLEGTGASVPTPRLVLWPSSKSKPLSTWALRVPGARCISGAQLGAIAEGAAWMGSADPKIVERLSRLLIGPAAYNYRRAA